MKREIKEFSSTAGRKASSRANEHCDVDSHFVFFKDALNNGDFTASMLDE
jgi:hypothetical protein